MLEIVENHYRACCLQLYLPPLYGRAFTNFSHCFRGSTHIKEHTEHSMRKGREHSQNEIKVVGKATIKNIL